MAHVVPWERLFPEKKVDKQGPFGKPSPWDLFFIPVLLGLILNKNIYGILWNPIFFLPQITELETYPSDRTKKLIHHMATNYENRGKITSSWNSVVEIDELTKAKIMSPFSCLQEELLAKYEA